MQLRVGGVVMLAIYLSVWVDLTTRIGHADSALVLSRSTLKTLRLVVVVSSRGSTRIVLKEWSLTGVDGSIASIL